MKPMWVRPSLSPDMVQRMREALRDALRDFHGGDVQVSSSNTLRSSEKSMARRTTTTFADAPAEAPALAHVPATLAEVTTGEQAQAWFENKVVRAVREAGHCSEALRIMDQAFGAPLDKVGVWDHTGNYGNGSGSQRNGRLYHAYLDSDGVDCWGNTWRDEHGYDRAGFNRDGWDKDGFNKAGLDKEGFNREGLDANGISRTDPSRFAYDHRGFTADGYDRSGYDRNGFNRDGNDRYGGRRPEKVYAFDANGYDVDGWNADGYNRAGESNRDARLKYQGLRNARF